VPLKSNPFVKDFSRMGMTQLSREKNVKVSNVDISALSELCESHKKRYLAMTSFSYFENILSFSSLPKNQYFTPNSAIMDETNKKGEDMKQIEISILEYWRTLLYLLIPAQCYSVTSDGFKWLKGLICLTGGLLIGSVNNIQQTRVGDDDDSGGGGYKRNVDKEENSNENIYGEKGGMEICKDLINFLIHKCSSSQLLQSHLSHSKLEEKTSHATMTISSAMLILFLLAKLNYISSRNLNKVWYGLYVKCFKLL
jgi:hypothetical protein